MEPGYQYYKTYDGNVVSILNIYGSRAILILFYVHQDTESE